MVVVPRHRSPVSTRRPSAFATSWPLAIGAQRRFAAAPDRSLIARIAGVDETDGGDHHRAGIESSAARRQRWAAAGATVGSGASTARRCRRRTSRRAAAATAARSSGADGGFRPVPLHGTASRRLRRRRAAIAGDRRRVRCDGRDDTPAPTARRDALARAAATAGALALRPVRGRAPRRRPRRQRAARLSASAAPCASAAVRRRARRRRRSLAHGRRRGAQRRGEGLGVSGSGPRDAWPSRAPYHRIHRNVGPARSPSTGAAAR